MLEGRAQLLHAKHYVLQAAQEKSLRQKEQVLQNCFPQLHWYEHHSGQPLSCCHLWHCTQAKYTHLAHGTQSATYDFSLLNVNRVKNEDFLKLSELALYSFVIITNTTESSLQLRHSFLTHHTCPSPVANNRYVLCLKCVSISQHELFHTFTEQD